MSHRDWMLDACLAYFWRCSRELTGTRYNIHWAHADDELKAAAN